jgi:hypothetical protein
MTDRTGETKEHSWHPCVDCGVEAFPRNACPMITPFVWASLGLRRDFICRECLEQRLGRPLCRQDLRTKYNNRAELVPFNTHWEQTPEMTPENWSAEFDRLWRLQGDLRSEPRGDS